MQYRVQKDYSQNLIRTDDGHAFRFRVWGFRFMNKIVTYYNHDADLYTAIDFSNIKNIRLYFS